MYFRVVKTPSSTLLAKLIYIFIESIYWIGRDNLKLIFHLWKGYNFRQMLCFCSVKNNMIWRDSKVYKTKFFGWEKNPKEANQLSSIVFPCFPLLSLPSLDLDCHTLPFIAIPFFSFPSHPIKCNLFAFHCPLHFLQFPFTFISCIFCHLFYWFSRPALF